MVAIKRRFGLGENEWRAGHAFDASRHVELSFAERDRPRRVEYSRHAGTAEPVDRQSAGANRQTGKQAGETRYVPSILARLANAAENHVLDVCRIKGVTGHEFADHMRGHIVRSKVGEGAGMAAKGRTNAIVDEGIKHRLYHFSRWASEAFPISIMWPLAGTWPEHTTGHGVIATGSASTPV